jgi:hypothetical protein
LRIKLNNIDLIFTLALFSVVLSACSYRVNQRAFHIVAPEYPIDLEIHFSDYFLCSIYREGWRYERNIQSVPHNEDSLLNMVQEAFDVLPLRIHYAEQIQHHCDSATRANHHLKMQKIDETKLKNLAIASGKKVSIIPVFVLDTWDLKFLGPIRSANGNRRSFFVTAIVYVFQDGEIIYSRKINLGQGKDIDQWDPDPQTPMTQEHWNKLVYLLMKKYLERRKN